MEGESQERVRREGSVEKKELEMRRKVWRKEGREEVRRDRGKEG